VVDKLLVGFDEPRNTVLYIDKPLREHGLLQAIARVNRLFEGKEFGFIVDYRGVLGQLNEALETYNALEGFDAEDVAGTITDMSAVIDTLPGLFEQLWAIFDPVPNKQDNEAMERFLEPEDRRAHFYDALTAYARALKVALSVVSFYADTPEKRIAIYKRDLVFFHNLRNAVKLRYAEAVDYGEYEQKIRKLMNDHIKAEGVSIITEAVNIFNQAEFEAAVSEMTTPASRADAIAYRLKKTAIEEMEKDPAFYRKFSQMIEETIEAYKQGRIDELDYLSQMETAKEEMATGKDSPLPPQLAGYRDANAYYGLLLEPLARFADGTQPEFLSFMADLAIACEQTINEKKVRDWAHNPDVINQIKGGLDDLLYSLKLDFGIALTNTEMDTIIDNVVETAKKRDHLS
jgi:type I restriction enzyme, R subunit